MKQLSPPVSSMPRSTGLNGSGSTGAPAAFAMVAATASACWVSEAALLDRERGAVAGCVDAWQSGHPAVRVDRDESLAIGGDAGEPHALQAGQAHHAVHVDAPASGIDDQAVVLDLGMGGADELDRGGLE